MLSSQQACLLAVSLVTGLACCSACQNGSPGDASPTDVRPDREPIPDLALTDRGSDGPVIPCGGSRKVNLVPVQRGPGLSCGTGCKQVTFGTDVNIRYEVKGDLLVYSG